MSKLFLGVGQLFWSFKTVGDKKTYEIQILTIVKKTWKKFWGFEKPEVNRETLITARYFGVKTSFVE